MTFTSTRPTNPHQLAFLEAYSVGLGEDGQYGQVFCNTDCERGSAYCGWDAGGFSPSFSIPEERRFKLFSEEVQTDDPRHPDYDPALADQAAGVPHSSEFWYTHEDAEGHVSEGAGRFMQVVVRFDLDAFLFLEGIGDPGELEDYSDAELLRRLLPREMANLGTPDNHGTPPVQSGWVEVTFTSSTTGSP